MFLFQGRTFASLIQNYVDNLKPLNEVYLPLYETEAGRRVYEETLVCVQEQFPQYLKEIEGTAEGAKVPFHKVITEIRDGKTEHIIINFILRLIIAAFLDAP